ncbi:unnamed protein product [Fusarium graminearum]|nr:unnamed protein product [Fusarium graminearum]
MEIPGPLQVLYRAIRATRAAFPLANAYQRTRGPIPHGAIRERKEKRRSRVNQGSTPPRSSPSFYQDRN